MDLTTAIAITLIAIFFSAFFSGAEIAFVQSNKVRIEIDATKKGAINHVIHRFSRNADMFISTLLVGNNIALVIYGIGVSILINPLLNTLFDGNQALVLITNTLASTAVILITGEFLPKTVFRINPNFTMRIIALPLYLIYMLLYPLSLFTAWLSRGIMRLFGIKNTDKEGNLITMEQLDDYIQQSIDDAPESDEVENEVKIFRNAIDFKDTQVGECMRPRNEIIAVNIDTTDRQKLINTFMQTGLSKIVVYREDIDNVLGYIHVSELFTKDIDWKECLKPVIFTPESMLANTLMRRLLAEKRSMAIIIDEFGGTAGLVTLEDLVEEIFGEIEDEHDRQRLTVREHANGDLEISGRAEIEHLNEQYKLDLKESDTYHTLAGYILDNLEALPAKGDTFEIEGYSFTILTMTDTRIEWILVHPLAKE